MNQFQKWMRRRVQLPVKILALLLAGGLFVFLIPYTLVVLAPRLDAWLGLPDFYIGWINILVCVLLVICGGYFAFSSIFQQLFKADGTPLPFIPTQKLLANNVFQLTRNPMTLGTICIYTGVAILAGSISALLVVILFFSLLLIYIKKIEERELEIRFGKAYLHYKNNRPFLFPRFKSGKSNQRKKM
ncbi:MAG TPA: isoprenylcysteine carboxylmethyltransferase family protein [Anaerolineaceae bacterium]|nr:isoprenylcysteine carboxylmethyltransferase family protein [Anaerolineaceae bacterium]